MKETVIPCQANVFVLYLGIQQGLSVTLKGCRKVIL